MKKEKINTLLEEYYKGETSLQEEVELREAVENGQDHFLDEELLFGYYKQEAFIPDDLEEKLFAGILEHENTQKQRGITLKNRWLKYSSIAAAVCLFVSVLWFSGRNSPEAGLTDEQQFAIMEQALVQMSFGVQPTDNKELLVLFQDENLEIVVE
jgi:hypothetical protein